MGVDRNPTPERHRIYSALKFIPLGANFATIIGNRRLVESDGKTRVNWARVSHFQH